MLEDKLFFYLQYISTCLRKLILVLLLNKLDLTLLSWILPLTLSFVNISFQEWVTSI
jgi:hypothetical protein